MKEEGEEFQDLSDYDVDFEIIEKENDEYENYENDDIFLMIYLTKRISYSYKKY